MTTPRLSTTELAVLGVLSTGPSHGFALSKALDASGEVGRIYAIHRPLVYRALDRLVQAGCAEPVATEKGEAGPNRVIHRVTTRGRRRLQVWLATPVDHVRDIRIELLLKLTLLAILDRSPLDLIRAQREAIAPTLRALETPADEADHVELWRRHNAAAAQAYLEELEKQHTSDQVAGRTT